MAKANFSNNQLKKWARKATELTFDVKVHKPVEIKEEPGDPVVIVAQKNGPDIFEVIFTTAGRGTNIIGGRVQRFQENELVDTKHFEIRGGSVRV